ncbi:MAG: hypothetical protein MUQ52_04500, partial [Pirellulales bacterium]|nr:hypothetical protein [Pirellulales bacterium]
LFHALAKQPLRAWGSDALGELTDCFVSKNYSIRKLIVEIVLVMTKPTEGSLVNQPQGGNGNSKL